MEGGVAKRGVREAVVSNLLALVIAIFMVGLGALAIYSSSFVTEDAHPAWNAVLTNIGGAIFTTGAISILWDLFSKRAFVSEVFSIAKLSEDIENSGLSRITTNFQHDMEWPTLLRGAKKMAIFFAYARTWRQSNLSSLENFAGQPGNEMTIVLPDPDDDRVMAELARRFQTDVQTARQRIDEAKNEFIRIFTHTKSKAKLKIWYVKTSPLLSFYRIDGRYVVAAYRHRPGRGDIPTFVCDREGDLTRFVDAEFAAMTDDKEPWTRCVYPENKPRAVIPMAPSA